MFPLVFQFVDYYIYSFFLSVHSWHDLQKSAKVCKHKRELYISDLLQHTFSLQPRSIVSFFYFYFYMLCSCVIQSAEASCQLRREAEKSANHQPPYVSRSLSFSRFITLSLFSFPVSASSSFSLYWFISPSFLSFIPLPFTLKHKKNQKGFIRYLNFYKSTAKMNINLQDITVMMVIDANKQWTYLSTGINHTNTILQMWINPPVEIVPNKLELHWNNC